MLRTFKQKTQKLIRFIPDTMPLGGNVIYDPYYVQ